jgi:hypothetical protein
LGVAKLIYATFHFADIGSGLRTQEQGVEGKLKIRVTRLTKAKL